MEIRHLSCARHAERVAVPGRERWLSRARLAMVLVVSGIALSGCFRPYAVPVSDRSGEVRGAEPVRVVRYGETLYSIAWETGKDPEQLAKWNNLDGARVIRPGQKLIVEAPASNNAKGVVKPLPRNKVVRQSGRATGKNLPPKPVAGPKTAQPAPTRWVWPVKGSLARTFSPANGRKGIDIAAREGTSVKSTAAGRVVYAGAGLRGYGRLVIVKHGDGFLSAYAHNRRLTVAEGQWVKAGQKIGEVGRSNRNRPEIHFEIRRNGEPQNPTRYLPRS